MKKINAFIEENQAGKIVGWVVNVIMAIAGLTFCVYGVYLQITNNL